MEINIAICDDSEAFIRQMVAFIKEYMAGDSNSYKLYACLSGTKLLDKIEKNYIPDLVFLDIDLKENMLGTSIGAKIKESAPNALLAYVSDYSCYYEELANAEPFCFIDKPIDGDDIKDVLDNAIRRMRHLKSEFAFHYKSNGMVYKVDLKKVMYFESQHRVIKIHMRSGSVIQYYEKLDNLEKEVEGIYPYFLRVNKSYYVNYHDISKSSRLAVTVDGMELKIGPNYKKSFREKMMRLA